MLTLPDVVNSAKDDSSDHITRVSSWLMPRFYGRDTTVYVSNITFSNQRFSNCNPTVNAEFVKLTLVSFCGNMVFKMNIHFCCHLCCSSAVIFRNNPSQCTTISVSAYFRPFFLFADVVFPWFVYADITLETVAALDIPKNVQFLSQMLQLNAHQRSVLFQNRISLPFSNSFARTIIRHNH
jgi:hypothetical protein